MGLSLNRVVKPQSDLLNKSATVFSDEKSYTKECPFTAIGYEKIKCNFENKSTK